MRVAAHDFEHVVLLGIDVSGVHRRGAFRQRLHHLLLVGGGLDGNGFIAGFGRGQMKLIGGLDVRNLLEQRNEFREIEESRKSRAGTVAGALGNEFVKMIFANFLNSNSYLLKNLPTSRVCIFLEIPYSKASLLFPIASH